VCRPVWVSEACQLFLVPSRSSNTTLYPSKCCELGNVPRLLPLPLCSTWTHIWILQGVGSASLLCFKDVESQITCFLFFVFGFVLLFCKLLCLMLFFNGVALVNWFWWWSKILVVQSTIFMGNVSHNSWKWLVLTFKGAKGCGRRKTIWS